MRRTSPTIAYRMNAYVEECDDWIILIQADSPIEPLLSATDLPSNRTWCGFGEVTHLRPFPSNNPKRPGELLLLTGLPGGRKPGAADLTFPNVSLTGPG